MVGCPSHSPQASLAPRADSVQWPRHGQVYGRPVSGAVTLRWRLNQAGQYGGALRALCFRATMVGVSGLTPVLPAADRHLED